MKMLKRSLLAVCAVMLCATAAAAQPTIIVVRHAERSDTGTGGMAVDPDLSAAGRARAQRLAAILRDVPLTAVFATEFRRTRETAEPTAKAHDIAITTIPAKNTAALVARLKSVQGTALVVGHGDTVGAIVSGLGVAERVKVADDDFDNLFIVVEGTPPQLVHLRYGEPAGK
jgi:broad specificity phosphatase PhoE